MDYKIILKMLVLIFSTILYASSGIFMTFLLDKYILYNLDDKTDDEINKKTSLRHFIDLLIILCVVTLVGYLTRNLCYEIFKVYLDSLNTKYGFDYDKIKELSSGLYLNTILFLFTGVLTNKVQILRNRFSSTKLL